MAINFQKLCVLLMAFSLRVKEKEAINLPQALATKSSSIKSSLIRDSWKPIDWIYIPEIETIPPVNTISWQELQQMPLVEATNLIDKIYYMSRLGRTLEPIPTGNIWDIPVIIISPSTEKITLKLSKLLEIIIAQPNIGLENISIVITGMPSQDPIVDQANNDLIAAYIKRYFSNDMMPKAQQKGILGGEIRGNLIIIDVGATIRDFKDFITLDIEKIGSAIGDVLVQMTEKLDIPRESIHIIGQNMGAHIAGIAGRQYLRSTGHHIRRITGLDPSKIFIRYDQIITGLGRGDADYVDVIHSSVMGLGMIERCGDIDFYPNGPVDFIEDADNIIEAAMRATRYYAETVIPGNELSFPAVATNSIIDYNTAMIKGIDGKRAFLGFPLNYNVKGDFILKINGGKRFGRRQITAPKQSFPTSWKITYRH